MKFINFLDILLSIYLVLMSYKSCKYYLKKDMKNTQWNLTLCPSLNPIHIHVQAVFLDKILVLLHVHCLLVLLTHVHVLCCLTHKGIHAFNKELIIPCGTAKLHVITYLEHLIYCVWENILHQEQLVLAVSSCCVWSGNGLVYQLFCILSSWAL